MPEEATLDQSERSGSPLDVSPELADNISALIDAGQQAMVLNLVADLYPADIERLLTHLPLDEAKQLFRWLPHEDAGEVLPELDSSFRAMLLEETTPNRIAALVDELDTDDAVDVLAGLPDDIAREVLPSLEDAAEIEQLLIYDEETAGGLMDREYVAVLPSWTVEEVTEEVRRNAEEVDIYGVFIVDEEHRLQGIVPLKRILLSKPETLIGTLMEQDIISVQADMDQEEVARIMERYDIVSLPVVDEAGRLVGRITIDDVVDVLREEAEEDIQRMSGVTGGEEPTDSVMRITQGRLPWLLIGLVGAVMSGFVIFSFEPQLEEAVVLAGFIPVVMAMAGNAGIQSSAIVVQGVASGDLWASDVFQRLGKEVAVALINGVVLAFVLWLIVLILPYVPLPMSSFEDVHAGRLGLTVALSLLAVILLATVIGTAVPLLLHRFGIDPALATGPFITTSNDILGLAVFFTIATLLYL